LLRLELNRVPPWRGNQVVVRQLADDFARYLYLPRLRDSGVLAEAISDGLGLISWIQDSFAYADGWEAQSQRYRGLQVGRRIHVDLDSGGLLVKPEIAQGQFSQHEEKREGTADKNGGQSEANGGALPQVTGGGKSQPESAKVRRFHGSLILNPVRLGRDAGEMANEIVQHLMKQPGTKVEVTVEIVADLPSGASDDVVGTVSENRRTLKFSVFGFEQELRLFFGGCAQRSSMSSENTSLSPLSW
jgi:hypothetical protein